MQSQRGKSLSQSKQLVFLDESGDVGTKTKSGSSPLFIVALTFIDQVEAEKCNQAINELRAKLKKPDNYEFHFSDNSDKVRMAFIKAVEPFDYQIIAVSFDKNRAERLGQAITSSKELYFYTSNMVITAVLPRLHNATLYIDKSGSKQFQTELRKSIRYAATNAPTAAITKYQAMESHKNNLLQLADYSVGVIARWQNRKSGWQVYYNLIKSKIAIMQELPL